MTWAAAGQPANIMLCNVAFYHVCTIRPVSYRCSWRGVAWRGVAWRGVMQSVLFCSVLFCWLGLARLGFAWLGLAWLGLAWASLSQSGSAVCRAQPAEVRSRRGQPARELQPRPQLTGFQTGSGQTGFPQKGHISILFAILCFKCARVVTFCHIFS